MAASRKDIRRALDDQVRLSVDFPVLPQLRDFVEIYVEPLVLGGAIEEAPGGYRLKEESVAEVKVVVPWDLEYGAELARKRGLRFRLAFTGPFTIASRIGLPGSPQVELSKSVLSNPRLTEEVVSYASRLAELLSRELRPYMVCIDEPILSVIVGSRRVLFGYTTDYIRESLDRVLAGFEGVKYRGVHVCSRLPPLLKEVLLGLKNVEFLDHEFHDIPENRGFYSREELEESGKYIAYGVISSKKVRVEDLEEVYGLIEQAYGDYSDRLLLVKPDCGFGGLRGVLGGREYEEIVLKKVEVLVKATRRFNASRRD